MIPISCKQGQEGCGEMAIHVVQQGESLWSISKRYDTDVSEIMDVNGLQSGVLVPGLALYIPEKELFTRIYLFQPNDTLAKIAEKFDVSVSDILKTNPGIDPKQLITGQRLEIISPFKLELTTLAFAFPAAGESVLTSFSENAEHLTLLAIVAYSFTTEGNAFIEGNDEPLINKALQLDVIPLLMVRNYENGDFNEKLAGDVLASKQTRDRLVNSLLKFVKEKGYGGVSVDMEFIPPARRADFVLLLRQLKRGLQEKILHVNVHAKTEDNPTNRIVGGHDYQEIGKVADLVAVMTIDYGYPTGPPEPIAPLWWMAQVIRYARSVIPIEKLQSAFPLYGYDKVISSNKTTALSALSAQNRAIKVGSAILYDQAAASPNYRYYAEQAQHSVWFEDIRSFTAKYQLIDAYDLAGVTYWHIGLAFPQNWAYVERNLLIRKGL